MRPIRVTNSEKDMEEAEEGLTTTNYLKEHTGRIWEMAINKRLI